MSSICPPDSRLAGLPSFHELTSKLSFNELVQESIRQNSVETPPPQEHDDFSYSQQQQQPQPQLGTFCHLTEVVKLDSATLPFPFPDSATNEGRMELLSDVAHVRSSLAEPTKALTKHCTQSQKALVYGGQSKEEAAYTSLTRFFDSSHTLCNSISQMRSAFRQISSPVLQNPSGLYDSQLLYATQTCGTVYSTNSLRLKEFASTIPASMTQDLEAALSDITSALAALLFLQQHPQLQDVDPDIQRRARSRLEPISSSSSHHTNTVSKRSIMHDASRFKFGNVMPSKRTEKLYRQKRPGPPKVCANCKVVDAPEWRRGPDATRSLCNACGLFYKKLVTKYGYQDADCIFYYRQIGDTVDRTVPGLLERNLIVQHSRQTATSNISMIESPQV